MSEPETCALPLGFTDRMRRLLGAGILPRSLRPTTSRAAPPARQSAPAGRHPGRRAGTAPPSLRSAYPSADGWYYPDDPPCVPADTRTMRRGCTIFRGKRHDPGGTVPAASRRAGA